MNRLQRSFAACLMLVTFTTATASEAWQKTNEVLQPFSAIADPIALENQHIQQVMRARLGDEEGIGVLEQICFGPHATYGFKEFLEGAS